MSYDWPLDTSGLDNQWPYDGPWNAVYDLASPELTVQLTNDNPETSLGGSDISYTIGDSYEMSAMYLPPGAGSQWVRLWRFDWIWFGGDDRGSASGSWTNPPPCPTITTDSQADTTHPTWIQKIVNGGGVITD